MLRHSGVVWWWPVCGQGESSFGHNWVGDGDGTFVRALVLVRDGIVDVA